jgi:hypothetical protein
MHTRFVFTFSFNEIRLCCFPQKINSILLNKSVCKTSQFLCLFDNRISDCLEICDLVKL